MFQDWGGGTMGPTGGGGNPGGPGGPMGGAPGGGPGGATGRSDMCQAHTRSSHAEEKKLFLHIQKL
jgi:hypothetical protein